MRNLEFHNREKEIKEMTNILDAKPTLITLIYGPINSGKTELINHIIPQLPEEYAVFYINLLFVDPVRKLIRSQSKLDLLAIREIMKNGTVGTSN